MSGEEKRVTMTVCWKRGTLSLGSVSSEAFMKSWINVKVSSY